MFKFIRQWWSGSKECFCCKRWFSSVVLLKGACLECRSKLAYFPEIKTVTIAEVIEKFLNDASRISEQTFKILSLEKTLEERDLSSSQQKLDWYKARDGYVATVARLSNEIQQLQENIRDQSSAFEHGRATLLQREATIRELEFKVKQFDERVTALTEERAATVAHLNDELAKAIEQSNTVIEALRQDKITLTIENGQLRDDIARLKYGKFTPDELQDLCHNLSGDCVAQYEAFCDGCASYQRKMFGKADRDAFAATEQKQKEELNRLRQILSVWDKAGEAIIRAYKIEHSEKPVG